MYSGTVGTLFVVYITVMHGQINEYNGDYPQYAILGRKNKPLIEGKPNKIY